MLILIGVLFILSGCMILCLYKKMSISFDLIFNKLHIDTDIWGGRDV